jgi:hypothetical protein
MVQSQKLVKAKHWEKKCNPGATEETISLYKKLLMIDLCISGTSQTVGRQQSSIGSVSMEVCSREIFGVLKSLDC